MKCQRGIALVASLLVLVALMTLAVGAFALSTMNLKIAENAQAHETAYAHAQAGLEAALIALKKAYDTSGSPQQYPASLTLPTPPNTSLTYSLYSYTPISTGGYRTRARVTVLGLSPSGAIYKTEALLGSGMSATSANKFPIGLASKDVVDANGGPTIINAPLQGDKGYILGGSTTFETCDANGICKPLTGSAAPIAAATGMDPYTCQANSSASIYCMGGKPLTLKEPLTFPAPAYSELRNGTTAKPGLFGITAANLTLPTGLPGCTYTLTLATTYPAGSKICLLGGATIPNGANYKNVTIISGGSISLAKQSQASFDGVNLLSMNQLDLQGPITLNNSRLLADKSVISNNNVAYTGNSTIASGGTFEIGSTGGGIYNSQGTAVGLALISAGDFTAQGSLKGASTTDYANVAIWSGGTMAINGGAKVRGGLAATKRLTIKGSSEVIGDASFTNTDLPIGDPTVVVMSRR